MLKSVVYVCKTYATVFFFYIIENIKRVIRLSYADVSAKKERGEINDMFKKILTLILSAAMALSLVACGEESSTKTSQGEIKLGDYKEAFVVYEEDMKSFVDSYYMQAENYMLSMCSTTKTLKKGKVKKDSTVVVDYSGEIEVDGKKVAFEGGTASDASINVGTDASNYIDGFVSCLVGHKVGDKFTEKLQFPDSYTNTTKVEGKDVKLAGKDVWFTYTIKNLTVTETPEKLTDKLVKDNAATMGLPAQVTDIKSFESYMRETYEKNFIVNKVLEKLLDTCEVVSYDKEEESKQFEIAKRNIESQYNIDFASYLEACQMTEKEWREKEETIKSVKDSLKAKMIIMAIAEKEGLLVDDEAYKKEAESIGEQMSVSVEELESQYGKSEVEYAIVTQKVQDFIAENVTKKEGTEPTTAAPETTTAAETKSVEETTEK